VFRVPVRKGGRTESRDASSLVVYAEVRTALGEAKGEKKQQPHECYNVAAADGWSYT